MLLVYLRIYLNRLKNLSVYKALLNNFFLIAFLITLLLFSLEFYIFLTILTFYFFYLFKHNKVVFAVGLLLSLVIALHYWYLNKNVQFTNYQKYEGKIIDIEEKERYQKIKLKTKNYFVIVYDYDFVELFCGNHIQIEGTVLKADSKRIDNGFNYQHYLKINKISATVLSERIYITENKKSILNLKKLFTDHINRTYDSLTAVFLKGMVLGDESGFDEDLNQAIKDNGIMHLFAVSGLHIALFVAFLYYLLGFLKINKNMIEGIICLFLMLYLIVTSFSPSVVRASLMFFLTLINKRWKFGLSSLDIISIIFLFLLIINPFYMYNIGFQLSFLAAFTIMLSSDLIKKYHKINQIVIISVFCSITTLPIIININNSINVLNPFINVIFIEIVSIIILPFSFMVLLFPPLQFIYRYVILSFSELTIFISRLFNIKSSFPNFNMIMIAIYYFIIFLIIRFFRFKKYRYVIFTVYCFLLFLFSNQAVFSPYGEVDFLDLYNGEAIFIQSPFNQCKALIDTGDGKNQEVTSYLKSKGIKKIDYLFLTHNHHDHNGEALNILNEIVVNNLVVSAYDNSGYALHANYHVSKGDILKCKDINFEVIHPDQDYHNENDNSIVIYSRIGHHKFLFLGDISKTIEEKIAKMDLDVNVIKIAHHGSNTSTSPYFIGSIQPQIAIIQTGRIDKFGFPHQQPLATLIDYNVTIYRTDLNYSIKYKFSKNKSIFKTIK